MAPSWHAPPQNPRASPHAPSHVPQTVVLGLERRGFRSQCHCSPTLSLRLLETPFPRVLAEQTKTLELITGTNGWHKGLETESVGGQSAVVAMATPYSALLENKDRDVLFFSIFVHAGLCRGPGTQWAWHTVGPQLVWVPLSSSTKNRSALQPPWSHTGIPVKSYLFTQMSLSKVPRGRAGSESASGPH